MPGDDTGSGDGADEATGGAETGDDEAVTRERSFRGISSRLAVSYLRTLGGERVDADTDEEATEVSGDGWRAALSTRTVNPAGSLELTEVTIVFEGDRDTVDPLVERFAQKAMRAGG